VSGRRRAGSVAGCTATRAQARRRADGSRFRVSANPLINEVVIPLGKKDGWNAREPYRENQEFIPIPGPFPVLSVYTLLNSSSPSGASFSATAAAAPRSGQREPRPRDDLSRSCGTGHSPRRMWSVRFPKLHRTRLADMLPDTLNPFMAMRRPLSRAPQAFLGGDTSGPERPGGVADNRTFADRVRRSLAERSRFVRPPTRRKRRRRVLTDGAREREGLFSRRSRICSIQTRGASEHSHGLMALATAARGRPGATRRRFAAHVVESSPTPWGHLGLLRRVAYRPMR